MGIEAAKRKGRVFRPAEPVELRVRCLSSLPRTNFSGQEVWRADFVLSPGQEGGGELSGKPSMTLQISGLRQNRFMAGGEYVLTVRLAGASSSLKPQASSPPRCAADAFREFLPYMLAEDQAHEDGSELTGDELTDYILETTP